MNVINFIDPRGKLFSHLDRLFQLKAGLRPPPINIEIDLMNRCNLDCRECHFGYLHTHGELPNGYEGTGDIMDHNLALSLPRILKRWGVNSVTWTGGGEPTIYPHLDDILEATAEAGLDQGIYTNGTLITERTAYVLRQTCTWIYVSLDHSTREQFTVGKGVDAFDNACRGVKRLLEVSGKAVVGLGFLLHEKNWHDCWHMLKLGRELGVDYIQFRPRIVTDPTCPGMPAEDIRWAEACIGLMSTLEKEPDVVVDTSRFSIYVKWQGHNYDMCWWCGLQAVITPDGRIWTCANRRGQPAALLGDLNLETPELIWEKKARLVPEPVGKDCRVLCRGHLPNLALHDILAERPHANFI